ncbi:MAG: radical SAM protein [Candidatus Hydrogenedentota bacterium]
MKILFLIPFINRKEQWGPWRWGAGNNQFNYGIASLAGYLESKEIDVGLIDMQFLKDKDLGIMLNKEMPDLIGISCYTPTYKASIELARLCKNINSDVKIIFGGAHPSLYPRDTLEENSFIDFVVVGEGEITLYELIKALQDMRYDFSDIKGLAYRKDGKVLINPKREFIDLSKDSTLPAYKIFPLDKYIIQATSYKKLPTYTLVASRGCPYNCTFCQVKQFLGSRMRYKSPEILIKEIRYLKDNFNARGIMFQDSTFTTDWNWLKKFCKLMTDERLNDLTWMCFTRADRVNKEILSMMKRTGCYGMSYGVESANQKSLDLLKKGIKIEQIIDTVKLSLEMGFYVTTTYMLGIPGEDESDVMRTIKLANTLATHIAHFYLPIPYPESELYYQCKETGGLREDIIWEDYNMFDDERPVYINPKIGLKKMVALKNYAVKKYYINPRVIWRNIKEINSKDDIIKYWDAVKSLAGFFINR